MKQYRYILLCLLCSTLFARAADPDSSGALYECDTSIRLEATPSEGYHFVCWSDGSTDNPRHITVGEDASYVAFFAPDNPGPSTGVNSPDNESPRPHKIIRGDQVLIIRDGKTYNVQGQEVR